MRSFTVRIVLLISIKSVNFDRFQIEDSIVEFLREAKDKEGLYYTFQLLGIPKMKKQMFVWSSTQTA